MKRIQELDQIGRTWARNLLPKHEVSGLRRELDTGIRPGERLTSNKLSALTDHFHTVLEAAQKLLPDCQPVGAIVFNKSGETNWSVGWHQDRVIAVTERHEAKGFKNWTKKSGVWYCEPPIEILEQMIFARIHLDVATQDNGCLEVAIGSHKLGRLPKPKITSEVNKLETEMCMADAGDILFGKALLVHRSKPSVSRDARLAARIDFANVDLPKPLQWAF